MRLRKEMDLFANLRPAVTFDALLDASTLKPEVIQGLDIMIVRELTAGVYFGEPRGMQMYEGKERCIDTQSYTKDEVVRVAEVAFDLARKRRGKVTSVEKANVMKTGVFWRQTVTELHKSGGYDDLELGHMYADNCAMQLVRNPKQFDVIVTDNLFGDMLSDCAAMLTGLRRRNGSPQGLVRARAWLRPRHRGPGQGQPAGHAVELRNEPALQL